MRTPEGIKHYFVDEAGDTTLFDATGAAIVGRPGVSNAFIVGVADVPDPVAARTSLESLRRSLLADPYFRGVPSMQPSAGKTADAFHAKDDVQEVRRDVFRLLPTLEVKVQVAFRRKSVLAAEAQRHFRATGRKTVAGEIYDDLIKRLFKNLLHRGSMHEVCFARRGKSDRQEALTAALTRAQTNFRATWNTDQCQPFHVRSSVPSQDTGLQVIDYYLWALQRLLERQEDRYFSLVAGQFSLIMDLDDKDDAPYGKYFTAANPLSLEKIKPLKS